MAVISGQITVGTTAVGIDGLSTNYYHLHVHNSSNTKNLYLGGPDLTISNGLLIPGLDSFEVTVSPNTQVYCISDSGSHLISWLRMDI
jgi:hypothetical protein